MKKILAVILSICMIACVGISLTACNKEKADFTVGILQFVKHPALDAATQGFKDALTEELAKEGKTVAFDEKDANTDINTCTTVVAAFKAQNVDLVMANATPALTTAKTAITDIPILGTSVTEYGIALGIDNFNGTVGGNVSGTSDLADLSLQAGMIPTVLPDAKTIGLLYCSAEANSKYQIDIVKNYLENTYHLTTKEYAFPSANELNSYVNKMVTEVDAVYIPTDNACADNIASINNICKPAGIPIIAGEEAICRGGGIATRSISYYELGKITGRMAAKILLQQADIKTMPIEHCTTQSYKYNKDLVNYLKNEKNVNIVIPEDYVEL